MERQGAREGVRAEEETIIFYTNDIILKTLPMFFFSNSFELRAIDLNKHFVL